MSPTRGRFIRGRRRKAFGYSVALWERIVQQVKKEVGIRSQSRMGCGKSSTTGCAQCRRSKSTSCAAPTANTSAGDPRLASPSHLLERHWRAVRADAPAALQSILTYGRPPTQPIRRGYPARTLLGEKTVAVAAGTRSEKWLQERMNAFQITVKVVPVASYDEGIAKVTDRSVDVFFADIPILLTAVLRHASSADLNVIDRRFTSEPVLRRIERGDEDFRRTVDRSAERVLQPDEFRQLLKHYGSDVSRPTLKRVRRRNGSSAVTRKLSGFDRTIL